MWVEEPVKRDSKAIQSELSLVSEIFKGLQLPTVQVRHFS